MDKHIAEEVYQTVSEIKRSNAMRTINKWNFKQEKYLPHNIPANRRISCFESDMDLTIDCAGCGTPMAYGDGYTSRVFHTQHGFGYIVCSDCYSKEWEEERQSREQ